MAGPPGGRLTNPPAACYSPPDHTSHQYPSPRYPHPSRKDAAVATRLRTSYRPGASRLEAARPLDPPRPAPAPGPVPHPQAYHSFAQIAAQPKLAVSTPGDAYEREADRVAQHVAGLVAPAGDGRLGPPDEPALEARPAPPITPLAQRAAEPASGAEPAGGAARAGIQQARGGGQPLPDRVLAPMERAFGHSFAGVRVHTDGHADRLSHSLRARAFTTGADIFFRRGQYQPESGAGRELLAHELTHVVQQRGRAAPGAGLAIQRAVGFEFETNDLELVGSPMRKDALQAYKQHLGSGQKLTQELVEKWDGTEKDLGLDQGAIDQELALLQLAHKKRLPAPSGTKWSAHPDNVNLELVTDPLNSAAEVNTTVGEIASFIGRAEPAITGAGFGRVSLQGLLEKAGYQAPQGYEYIFCDGLNFTTRPQATVGVKIEKIQAFLTRLTEQQVSYTKKEGRSERLAERGGAPRGPAQATAPILRGADADVAAIDVPTMVQKYLGARSLGDQDPAKLERFKNFLTLVYWYIKVIPENQMEGGGSGQWPKGSIPALARHSFYELYQEFGGDKGWFDPKLVLGVAGLSPEARLYSQGMRAVSTKPERMGPTLGQWLESIINPSAMTKVDITWEPKGTTVPPEGRQYADYSQEREPDTNMPLDLLSSMGAKVGGSSFAKYLVDRISKQGASLVLMEIRSLVVGGSAYAHNELLPLAQMLWQLAEWSQADG